MRRLLAIGLALLAGSIPGMPLLAAQDVKQGDSTITVFRSPMVITTTVAVVDQARWHKDGQDRWFVDDEYARLGTFTCDGISIRRNNNDKKGTWEPGLRMSARLRADDIVEVKVSLSVHNPKGNHDKAVSALFEVLDGETVVQSGTIKKIGIEEGDKQKEDQVLVRIPAAQLSKQPALALRITMTTKND